MPCTWPPCGCPGFAAARDTLSEVTPRTLYDVLADTARRHADGPALRQPKPGRERGYTVYSWAEYLRAVEEIAAALQISARTVKREWRLAKAWLKHELLKGGAA